MREQRGTPEYSDPARYVKIINDDDEPIPPYGVCVVTSIDDENILHVARPTKSGATSVLFNGPVGVPVGEEGMAIGALPAKAAWTHDSQRNDEPQAGDVWGVKADEWYLHREYPGFKVMGGVDGNTFVVAPMDAVLVGFVRKLSNVKDAVYGFYPGMLTVFNVITKSWDDVQECWYVEANEG